MNTKSNTIMENFVEEPFWRRKPLSKMTDLEWESLCDGCAKCCLNKIEDVDSGEILWTSVACSLLDCETCKCGDYENRLDLVSDCVNLRTKKLEEISWMPPTCAYRLIAEGKDLYWWHPLVSGSPETVHIAGISVKGRVVSEEGMAIEEYENHIVDWPGEMVEVEGDFSTLLSGALHFLKKGFQTVFDVFVKSGVWIFRRFSNFCAQRTGKKL